MHVSILTTVLCRLMSLECVRKRRHHNFGFIDPYQVNESMVNITAQSKCTEERLLKYFQKNEIASKILLAYNFQ